MFQKIILYLTQNTYILKGLNSLMMVGHVDVLEKPATFDVMVYHSANPWKCG